MGAQLGGAGWEFVGGDGGLVDVAAVLADELGRVAAGLGVGGPGEEPGVAEGVVGVVVEGVATAGDVEDFAGVVEEGLLGACRTGGLKGKRGSRWREGTGGGGPGGVDGDSGGGRGRG